MRFYYIKQRPIPPPPSSTPRGGSGTIAAAAGGEGVFLAALTWIVNRNRRGDCHGMHLTNGPEESGRSRSYLREKQKKEGGGEVYGDGLTAVSMPVPR